MFLDFYILFYLNYHFIFSFLLKMLFLLFIINSDNYYIINK